MVRSSGHGLRRQCRDIRALMPGIDNYAHGGGFLGGYAAGAGSIRSSPSAWIISYRGGLSAAQACDRRRLDRHRAVAVDHA